MELTDSVVPSYPPGKKAPFGPQQLHLAGFFFGPVGAAVLGIANWRRMGRSDRITAFVLLTVLLIVGVDFTWMILARLLPVDWIITNTVGMSLLLNALVGVWWGNRIARQQQPDYQAWVNTNGGSEPTLAQRGGCFRWLVLLVGGAMIWGLILQLIISPLENSLLQPLVARLGEAVTPAQTFIDPAFELTYSGNWYSFDLAKDPNYAPMCQQAECVLALNHREGVANFLIVRFSDASLRQDTLESLMKIMAGTIQEQFPDTEVSTTRNLTLNGQDMLQQIFYLQSPQGEIRDMFVLARQADEQLFRIEAITLRNGDRKFEDEIDSIIQSIRFK